MRLRFTIYYLLFLLIITGAFASMAQNDYGLKMISWACYSFAVIISLELLTTGRRYSMMQVAEHLGLGLLFALFGLRAAYVHFPYLEWVVVLATLILIISYGYSAFESHKKHKALNTQFNMIMWVYYGSVIFFLGSVFVRPLVAPLSDVLGGIGGLFLGVFILFALFKNNQLVEGEEVNLMRYVRRLHNHSALLLTGFFCMGAFIGLNMIGVVPTLYTQEVPQEYIKLVNDAEMGREEPVDGTFQHDIYKEELDAFLERHGTK